MDANRADEAMRELTTHLASAHSLLAWTMRWCPDGDASWEAIWRACTDAKPMLNVLVAVGAVRGASIRERDGGIDASDQSAFVIIAERPDDGVPIEIEGAPHELSDGLRSRFERPSVAKIVEAAGHRRHGR